MSTTFETVMSTTEKRERAESEATEGLDEQALAKKARKDARVSVYCQCLMPHHND